MTGRLTSIFKFLANSLFQFELADNPAQVVGQD